MGSAEVIYAPCPKCQTHTWAIVKDPKHAEFELLHCNECGFEVDMRVVQREQWILGGFGKDDDHGASGEGV